MKTMTCKQMGGPCDTPLHGSTPDEMMASGAAHVNQMASEGDAAHKEVLAMMEETQKNPESGKAWGEKFAADFAAIPED